MNRSLWPEGCEVHQIDLVRETQDTIDAIASRFTSNALMGIVDGLVVTPAGSAGKLAISNGSGYTPNGEYILIPIAKNNISLADYTNGTLNYVIAVYAEVYGDPQAHEDLGTTLPTSATDSFRLVVLSATAWNALPVTDPNLNNNSRDRSLLLAIVTANGSSLNPIAQGDIQGPTVYSPVYYISQPTNISGVYINGISANTLPGIGTLTFTIVSTQYFLQWTAPNDVIGAVSAAITADGTITLYSGSASPQYSITVTITFVDLPNAPSIINDSITISSIYDQPVPRLSAIDNAHRHLLGTGIPSVHNPHGLTIADIGGDTEALIQRHQIEMHANGILDPYGIGATNPSLSATIVSASGVNDQVLIQSMIAGGVVYINGLRVLAIDGSAYVPFGDVNANYIELYGVYMGPNGALSKKLRAQLNPPSSGSGELPPNADPFAGVLQPVNISDYNSVFDSLQDRLIEYDGAGNLRLHTPAGWASPGFWIPLSSADSNSIVRLAYPTSNTDTTPPVEDAVSFIDVWVDPIWIASSDAVSKSVLLRIEDRPPDATSYLLAYVVSQGIPSAYSVTTVMLGWGQYGNLPTLRTNHVSDRRLFGTLAGYDINDNTIGKEKIKDLSQSQVFNAISYIPYNGVVNPAGFALRTGAVGAEPVVTSHVMYADVAGSGGSTSTWATLTGKPAALAGMTGGNTFNQEVYFNASLGLAYNGIIQWGGNQYISGNNTGQLQFIASAGSSFSGGVSASSLAATTTIQAGSTVTAGTDFILPNSYTHTVQNVMLPATDYQAANKKYVDQFQKGAYTTGVNFNIGGTPTSTGTTPVTISAIPFHFGTPFTGSVLMYVVINSQISINISNSDNVIYDVQVYYQGVWGTVSTMSFGGATYNWPWVPYNGWVTLSTTISQFAYLPYDGYIRVRYYSSGPSIDIYSAVVTYDNRSPAVNPSLPP